jgi:Zn-dependent membrane protease YugP
MLFGYFWGDWTLIIVLPALIFTMWTQFSVQSTYQKYSQMRNSRGLTGADAARMILNEHGLYNVRIEPIHGHLNDHYDPRANVIRLSDNVFGGSSVAALGVAAHEAGHAIQYATEYSAIRLRNSILPVCRVGSVAAMPLFLIGLFLASDPLMLAGIAAYCIVTLFQLLTLPVEFDASRRAIAALEGSGYLYDKEADGVRRVLRAAAMTYVAALATSLLTLLRLLVLVSASNDRRR